MGKERKRYKIKVGKNTNEKRVKEERKWRGNKVKKKRSYESKIPYLSSINPLTPNDDYSGRTAPLTSKRYILYNYSTNIATEYFKHGMCIYSPSFPLKNAVCFIILTYLFPVLFTFYIQDVLKLKK